MAAGIRFVFALLALGTVSAYEISFESLSNVLYEGAMKLFSMGQTHYKEGGDEDHHHHKGRWHKQFSEMRQQRMACKQECGTASDCHAKCPKPWVPFVKTCQDLPAIKACHETCKEAECDNCPKFQLEWMNQKLAKKPKCALKKAERKCPKIMEVHACHQACVPGDRECHHKCPKMLDVLAKQHGDHHHGDHQHGGHHHSDHHEHGEGHHEHGEGHHHHGDHHEHEEHRHGDHHEHGEGHHHGDHHDHDDHHERWHKMHEMMHKAHECHKKCGTDVDCHSKCPKPWLPMVKACSDFPAIKACRTTCKDADCGKCPKFDVDWMNAKFDKSPERAIQKAEKMCPRIEKAHACHKACTPGDFECHHKCPRFFGDHHHHEQGDHHGDHHHHEHGDHHHGDHHDEHGEGQHHHHGDDHHGHGENHREHWKKMHKKIEEAHACHDKCHAMKSGDDVACHAKCPKPWLPFVKACQAFPKIKACHDTCKDADCEKECPAFPMPWLDKKFAKDPERVTKMATVRCPKIEKAYACHQACVIGDRECHHKCHSMVHPGYDHGALRGKEENDPQPILV